MDHGDGNVCKSSSVSSCVRAYVCFFPSDLDGLSGQINLKIFLCHRRWSPRAHPLIASLEDQRRCLATGAKFSGNAGHMKQEDKAVFLDSCESDLLITSHFPILPAPECVFHFSLCLWYEA